MTNGRADTPPPRAGGRLRAAAGRLKAAATRIRPAGPQILWGAAGLMIGVAVATLLLSARASGPSVTMVAHADRAAIAAIVRETLMAEPEIIPEAINRLQQREVEKLLASNREAIETPYRGAWAGAREPDVVLVEFFDFACPFCRQSSEDVRRLLREDPGLRVVFRDMPLLGPDSERFARASLSAAEQGRYLAFYERVFAGQGALTQGRLIAAVRAARLDEAKVAADLGRRALDQEIERNIALGRALGLTGTPSYVVGNRILPGAVGYDELKAAIAQARAQAG